MSQTKKKNRVRLAGGPHVAPETLTAIKNKAQLSDQSLGQVIDELKAIAERYGYFEDNKKPT